MSCCRKESALETRAEVSKGAHVAFQKSLPVVSAGNAMTKQSSMGKISRRKMGKLALNPGHHHQRFAEVGLRLARRVRQGNEHLPRPQLRCVNVVLHDGVAAGEPVLIAQTLEDPLGRVPLLGRRRLVTYRMASMTPTHGPSLGRFTACCRW